MGTCFSPLGLVGPVLPISLRPSDPFVVLHIYVYGNSSDPRLRGHEHEPASFILHEIQEIVLAIHFKLQFVFSLKPKSCSSAELRSARAGRRPAPTRPLLMADS
jgi:hypothetical protein